MSWRELTFFHDLQTSVVCQECGKRVPAITDEHLQSKECTGNIKTLEEYKIIHHWANVIPPDIWDFNESVAKPQPKKQYARTQRTFHKPHKIGCNNGGQCPNCSFSSNTVVISSCKIHCHNSRALVLQEGTTAEDWYCNSFQVKKA